MLMKTKLQLPFETELSVIQGKYYVEIKEVDRMLETVSIGISYHRLDMLIKCLLDIQEERKNSAKKQEEQA